MVYLQCTVTSNSLITLNNVDHTNQTVLNSGVTFQNLYAPDLTVSGGPQGNMRAAVMLLDGTVQLTAGVVSAGSTLKADIAAGEQFVLNFFYPVPDDVAGLMGERMIIKT